MCAAGLHVLVSEKMQFSENAWTNARRSGLGEKRGGCGAVHFAGLVIGHFWRGQHLFGLIKNRTLTICDCNLLGVFPILVHLSANNRNRLGEWG